MSRNIVLVGGGGHCKSVIDVVESSGYNILGILDVTERIGEKILSSTIIGGDDDILKYVDTAEFLITVGFIKNASVRLNLYDRIHSSGGRLATVISPTAYVSKYAYIAEGTIIMHKAVVNAEANIGHNCIINTFANIEHESVIGHNCHISTGVMINGGCKIVENTFIGSQSVVAQGIDIVDNSIISAGSFIYKNIFSSGIYAGNPAQKIRQS